MFIFVQRDRHRGLKGFDLRARSRALGVFAMGHNREVPFRVGEDFRLLGGDDDVKSDGIVRGGGRDRKFVVLLVELIRSDRQFDARGVGGQNESEQDGRDDQ